MKTYLAIDIGASSGRHIVGYMEDGQLKTQEVYRFPNGQKRVDGHLIWDTDSLFENVKEGIRRAFEKFPETVSLSIDTWGVDYVLLRGNEEVAPTYAYRDSRTEEVIEKVHHAVPFEKLYSSTGIQFQKFNTVYQLYADKEAGRLNGVTDFLMIPEYLMYKLTGEKKKEYTNATTTGLVNAKTHTFDLAVTRALGLPDVLFGDLSMPGTLVGKLTPELERELGGNLNVLLCATHDTASAVEAIEMEQNAPYISSGTWSLLGMKTENAITDDVSRLSNYSNEGGVGYNRYQKNITGMWIIQSLRKELCPERSFDDIEKGAQTATFDGLFDVNDSAFDAPISMRDAVTGYFTERGQNAPVTEDDCFRTAYRSLADGYRIALADLKKNTGLDFPEIYIVGGGAKNIYLNRITEEITGVKVKALPIEATAIGNLKVQIKNEK